MATPWAFAKVPGNSGHEYVMNIHRATGPSKFGRNVQDVASHFLPQKSEFFSEVELPKEKWIFF